MTDLTGRAQTSALRTTADFVELGVRSGATLIPHWTIAPNGDPFGTLIFDAEPTDAEMDPWRLAAGAHKVAYYSNDLDDGVTSTSVMEFEFRGLQFKLMCAFPTAPALRLVSTLGGRS